MRGRFLVAVFFYVFAIVAYILIGTALWPHPPLGVALGVYAAIAALSVAVYGFSRD